jgi:phosphoribosyl-AMP cyclohydrolase
MIQLDFSKLNGLIPLITQDYKTNKVLMLGFTNEEAFRHTIETGKVHYYSRSRNKLWMKGEESGHTQEVKEIFVDCDEDTLLIKVEQKGGAACHVGYESCFYRKIKGTTLEEANLETNEEKVFDPNSVYKK